MSLNAREVAEILKALEASSFDTLDLEIGGVKLSLRRSAAAAVPARSRAETSASNGPNGPNTSNAPNGPAASAAASVVPASLAAQSAAAAVSPASAQAAHAPAGTSPVTAPLLGVFYRAPRPGEPAFVEVGSRVQADTIIGIIEVMKLMNTVRAGLAGEVVSIPARNGELVEYGEALLYVRPG